MNKAASMIKSKTSKSLGNDLTPSKSDSNKDLSSVISAMNKTPPNASKKGVINSDTESVIQRKKTFNIKRKDTIKKTITDAAKKTALGKLLA